MFNQIKTSDFFDAFVALFDVWVGFCFFKNTAPDSSQQEYPYKSWNKEDIEIAGMSFSTTTKKKKAKKQKKELKLLSLLEVFR